jgi:hypothetical protein
MCPSLGGHNYVVDVLFYGAAEQANAGMKKGVVQAARFFVCRNPCLPGSSTYTHAIL